MSRVRPYHIPKYGCAITNHNGEEYGKQFVQSLWVWEEQINGVVLNFNDTRRQELFSPELCPKTWEIVV